MNYVTVNVKIISISNFRFFIIFKIVELYIKDVFMKIFLK